MKLPDVLGGLLPKKEETKEYLFSLYLDRDAAAVAVWHAVDGTPQTESFAHALIAEDSWETRGQVIDRLLSAAEEKVGVANPVTKTVFGLPGTYLTAEGNITEAARPHLKKLSHMLELKPVGFVPLSQAIAFSLKKEEGVPPSVILVGCSGTSARVTIFRVGNVTHEDTIVLDDDPVTALETLLKRLQDGDVLPSRILLYGGNSGVLEDVRSKLLKHPWPSRTNFLHFPKIEIVPLEKLLAAVSYAGASETSSEMDDHEGASVASTVVAQAGTRDHQKVPEQVADETGGHEEVTYEAGDDVEEHEEAEEEEESLESDGDKTDDSEEEGEEEGVVTDRTPDDDELANVTMVTPETLGFKHEDVLVHPQQVRKAEPSHVPSAAVHSKRVIPRVPFRLPTSFSLSALKNIPAWGAKLPKMRGNALPLIAGGIVLLVVSALLYYSVPRATVTVLVASQSVDESTTLTVDPAATVADPNSKTIPGHTQEQSVSGEKTIAVTGKKNIGDPAKGTVTIYNKVTSSRNLTKGTVLSSGGVAFTLDSDVSVASASESIGSITFGKTTANVTARDIGPNGNLASGSEFTFAGISGGSISARNESAFTGGTSKQVTVVSRADQDALVKALTDELVRQAKQQLAQATSGERLIDATVKTEVSEKVFDAELNEEASQLHGKVTVKITGVSTSDSDIKAALSELVHAKIPPGYRLAPEQTKTSVRDVTVKKDGTITLSATLTAVSLPEIDQAKLKGTLAGKDVNTALAILKETRGVSGAEFRFALSPTQSRLPMRPENITITVMVQ